MPCYAGFDTKVYPGKEQMEWLKANTNLSWCGYYLAPAPSRTDASWMGARPDLNSAGWGCVPIYLGQQTAGPGSHNVTEEQGSIDGADAATLASSEGFPNNSYIYLDIETPSPVLGVLKDYIQAWTQALLTAKFLPGFYCSHIMADGIRKALDELDPTPNARIWAYKVTTADPHPFTGNISNIPTDDPGGCGFAGASAWQFEQNCVLTLPGAPTISMQVDLSTSNPMNP